MKEIIIKIDDLRDFCFSVLQKAGIKKNEALIAANIMTEAEMRGVNTHGVGSLELYLKRIKAGGIDARADVKILGEGPTWAHLDGERVFGLITAYKAARTAIKKAKENGMAVVGVKNGMHFGAAAYYAKIMAAEDLLGFSMCNVDVTMTIPGSAGRVIGNNPFSYAMPTGSWGPVVFDVAMSVAAGGKIKRAMYEGKEIPEGWMLDKSGKPTTDPKDFVNGGSLIPFGKHKGYGFALMVEILAGVLTGNALTRDITAWPVHLSDPCPQGFFFMALDINLFMPVKDFKKRMDYLIKQIKDSPKAEGTHKIYFPGEIENEKEKTARTRGILIQGSIAESLKKIAVEYGFEEEFDSISKEKQ